MFYITIEARTDGSRGYVLSDEQKRLGDCKLIVSHGKEYVNLPKDNGTGRQYFVRSKVDEEIDKIGTFAFAAEDKTPRTLSMTTRKWKERLTTEELAELEKAEQAIKDAEATIDRLHEVAMTRKPKTAAELKDEADKKAAALVALLIANGIEIPDELK